MNGTPLSGKVVLFIRAHSFGRDAHGSVREEGDTRLASQISRINPGDQWGASWQNPKKQGSRNWSLKKVSRVTFQRATLPEDDARRDDQKTTAIKHLIQTSFKYLQGWRLNHFPGQSVPMLDNPLGEEKFPNIQSKPPLAQLEAINTEELS
ncbi:hypothetical protein QYF61_023604 [Mycteria americana]|uniref:Uncharacterized protein n=1 Tax=Mycteria americana TaxID=33587 RepID=A0AAN7NAF2_MYCAM|nr:hypothetical protein QYF61_023604 [Mycteria americana]